MTVLRREDVQSKVASWDGGPYRMVCSPILTIVPLIIRRLRGPSLRRVMVSFSLPVLPSPSGPLRRCCGHRLERRPEEAGQLARDRHGDLGRGLVVFRQASEAAAQSLLCLIRDRNHAARLAFPAARERHADPRSMVIMARGSHQQPAEKRVPRAGGAM